MLCTALRKEKQNLFSAASVDAQLDASVVSNLLNHFSANNKKYSINVEQYCRFGDLPLMELTDYTCTDVIESYGRKFDDPIRFIENDSV